MSKVEDMVDQAMADIRAFVNASDDVDKLVVVWDFANEIGIVCNKKIREVLIRELHKKREKERDEKDLGS